MTKIISIGKGFIPKENQRPLTPKMIKALTEACLYQSKQQPFGPIDIKGSFTSLLNRGFINTRTTTVEGGKVISWYVTPTAIQMLRQMGINGPC